jgi:hypothetical protein
MEGSARSCQAMGGSKCAECSDLAYMAIDMLRQHIKPSERINDIAKTVEGAVMGVILE